MTTATTTERAFCKTQNGYMVRRYTVIMRRLKIYRKGFFHDIFILLGRSMTYFWEWLIGFEKILNLSCEIDDRKERFKFTRLKGKILAYQITKEYRRFLEYMKQL